MAITGGSRRKSDRQGGWINMLILCGFLFALLGYVWMDTDRLVSTTLMLTGLVVGIMGMAYSIKNENR